MVFLHTINIPWYEDHPKEFPPYEAKDIVEVFQSLDLNKDGKLSLEEMIIGFNNEPFSKFSMKYVNGRKESESEDEDESERSVSSFSVKVASEEINH